MRQIMLLRLWLGNAADGRDYRAALDAGVEAIVQLAAEEPPLQPPRDLIYCRFPIVDGPGNSPDLLNLAVTTVGNLIEKRVPLLVCCSFGLSRAPAIAAAAMAMVYQEGPEDCLLRIAKDIPADVAPGLWNDLLRC